MHRTGFSRGSTPVAAMNRITSYNVCYTKLLRTNIGTVHAERAGSQEAIARGKAELIEFLPKDGTAILNYDDPWVRPMAEKTQANVLFYGLDPQAELWADQIEGLGLQGILV